MLVGEAKFGYTLGALLFRNYRADYGGTRYYTAACHDAGPLDLFPETTVWP